GMPRHASTHAAGVVITEKPVTTYVPIAVNNGITVTQFDMDTIAELGLLKFDFLALRYLTIIHEAELQIREFNPAFDLTAVDMTDSATFDTICSGRCDGVFQLESTGIRQMLMQLRPRCLDDIIAAIALYRPGPMDSIPKYIEARHDPSKIHYCTPKLAPILDVTYGCIVYQEQVMQIFREIAGYSFGHADVVRRAISKKKQSVLDGERQAFLDGAVERGITEADATELFEDIVSFANYAFNKSHAAAYAVLSFRTAYLKTHYPREYESALLTSVISSTEKLTEYLDDCRKQKINILPPDINKSRSGFHVENGAIRFGMSAMKNVGTAFIDAIVAERTRNGEFADIDDFINRMSGTDMNKRQLETLIKSGALDSLGTSRSKLLAVYEKLLDRRSALAQPDMEGQIGMFDTGTQVVPPKPAKIEFPEVAEMTAREKLVCEKESCGLYLSGHILDDYSRHLSMIQPLSISDIKAVFQREDTAEDETETDTIVERPHLNLADKSPVTIAGVLTKRTNKATKNGGPMAFVTLEDRTASMEIVCFQRVLTKYGAFLTVDSVVAVSGMLSVREEEEPKLLADQVLPLMADSESLETKKQSPEAPANHPPVSAAPQRPRVITKIYLRAAGENDPMFRRARAVCEIFSGAVPVTFYFSDTKEYRPSGLFLNPTDSILGELRELLGGENVVVR
ncbi:MAG: DNA polymerase III subunit alpha, partial [Eubacteriales bacterium]